MLVQLMAVAGILFYFCRCSFSSILSRYYRSLGSVSLSNIAINSDLSSTSWHMWPLGAPQQRFVSWGCKVKSHYARLRPMGEASWCSSSMQGGESKRSKDLTQEHILTISTHDVRVKSHYTCLHSKGEASQCSSSMQGWTLTMLSFNPRVNSHYLYPCCKGKASWCSSLMQGQTLTMLSFNPRVSPHYFCPWCKGEVSLHSPLT